MRLNLLYKENFLILRYDEFFKINVLKKISFFLDINKSNFDSGLLSKKVNSSFTPANKRFYNFAFKISKFLINNDNYLLRNFLKKHFKKFVYKKKKSNLENIDMKKYKKFYKDEIFKLKIYLKLSTNQPFKK